MQIRVITMRYSEGVQGFSEDALRRATFGREVLAVQEHFFTYGNVPHRDTGGASPPGEPMASVGGSLGTARSTTGSHPATSASRDAGDEHTTPRAASSGSERRDGGFFGKTGWKMNGMNAMTSA